MTTETTAASDIYVGRDFGRHDYVVTPEDVGRYCDAVDDHNPMYDGPSPFGGPVAPALLHHSECYTFRDHSKAQPSWYLPNIYGNLHARQEWEFFRPVIVLDAIHSRSWIAERYVKRGREYVVNEVLFFDAEDRVISRGRTHQSFLQETRNEGMVIDKSREKAPGRRFNVDASAAIDELPPLQKQITDDMCWKFSGPQRNYHNDREMALRLGFPDVVVQGMMSTCFLSEMMTLRYGSGWIASGKMNVNLVNIVWGSDVLTCRGFVRDVVDEGAHQRAMLDIWVEKADGTKVTVGTASARA